MDQVVQSRNRGRGESKESVDPSYVLPLCKSCLYIYHMIMTI